MKSPVVVVGLGYVGLPLALLTAKKGFRVTGIDTDKAKVAKINRRSDPLGDSYIAQNIKGSALKATAKFQPIRSSDIILICVPTPVKNSYQPDLKPLKSAASAVAAHLKKGALIIVESTINPGVCDEVLIPLIEKQSGLKVNRDFRVAHCPERINPGDQKWHVENIPRVVGASDEAGLKRALEFYQSIINAPIKAMASLKEAEAVKIVENSFRDINIAFVNELAMSFTKLGISVKNVIDGAATKPFAFMPHYPSIGVGGHCIPVDPYYLIEYAKGYGFDHEFLSLARTINNRMPEYTVERLLEGLSECGLKLKDAKILLLGIAYKADVADDRESPSYKVLKILRGKGAHVDIYDPYFPDKSTKPSLEVALETADAIILATRHKEFDKLNEIDIKAKVFVDGQNAFDPREFADSPITYKGVGQG